MADTENDRIQKIEPDGNITVIGDSNYFEESTLYLHCILAYRKILLFDRIYTQIDTLIRSVGIS